MRIVLAISSLLFALAFPFNFVRGGDSWFPWKKSDQTSANTSAANSKPSSPRSSTSGNGSEQYGIKAQSSARTSASDPSSKSTSNSHWWDRFYGKKRLSASKQPQKKKSDSNVKSQVAAKKKNAPGKNSNQKPSNQPVTDQQIAGTSNVATLSQDIEFEDDDLQKVAQTAATQPQAPRSKLIGPSAVQQVASEDGGRGRSSNAAAGWQVKRGPVRRIAFDDLDTGDSESRSQDIRDQRISDESSQALDETSRDRDVDGVLVPFEKKPKAPQIQMRQSNADEEAISLTVRDAPLAIVLSMIAEQHGLNLVAGGDIDGRVTVTLTDVALDEALSALLTVNGYSWHRNRKILVVSKIGGENKTSPELRGVALRVFRLNYVSAEDIEKVVQGLISPAGHAVTTITDSKDRRRTREEIVVQDLPEFLARVEAYIMEVDRPPRQVLVEAHILQVALKDDCRHGINFQELININNTKISLSTTGFANPKASPAFFFGIDGTRFDALLEALRTTTDSKTLANSQVLCLNGQTARIQIGQQLGFLVTTTTQTSTLQNVNFLDVGVVLNITPTITDEGHVMMLVKPEVSGGQISPQGLPQEDTTEVETTVMLSDAQGMIIGGLIKEEDTEVQNKIPYVGDLWLIGRLFQRRTVFRQRNEVIIALIPHILPYPDEKQFAMESKLEQVSTPLLNGPLQRVDRRQWEPDLSDAIRNPKHISPRNAIYRLHDPYGFDACSTPAPRINVRPNCDEEAIEPLGNSQ